MRYKIYGCYYLADQDHDHNRKNDADVWKRLIAGFVYSIERNVKRGELELEKIAAPELREGTKYLHGGFVAKTKAWSEAVQRLNCEAILTDVDVIFKHDPWMVFKRDFDIAVTVRNEKAWLCSGVIFVKPTEGTRRLFRRWAEKTEQIYKTDCGKNGVSTGVEESRKKTGQLGVNQPALVELLESEFKDLKVLKLDSDIYNCCSQGWKHYSDNTQIVHITNKLRRRLMFGELNKRREQMWKKVIGAMSGYYIRDKKPEFTINRRYHHYVPPEAEVNNRHIRNPLPYIVLVSNVSMGRCSLKLYEALLKKTDINIDFVPLNMPIGKGIVEEKLGRADIIWFKGDHCAELKKGRVYLYNNKGTGILRRINGIKIRNGVKLMKTVDGSNFRRPVRGYAKSYGCVPLERFTAVFDKMTAITPDLNYPQLKGEWIPHAYDVEAEAFDYEPDYDNIVISYYHAQADCKFALRVLLPVLKRLRDEGYKFKAVGIGKGPCKTVSWEESLRIKRESTLYFSSISPIGCYGKSAVESLSMGVPTINHISETSFKQSGCDDYGSPFLRASNAAELYEVLKRVLKGEIDLKQVSVKSREYAIKYHSYDAVAVRLKRIFGEIIGEVL